MKIIDEPLSEDCLYTFLERFWWYINKHLRGLKYDDLTVYFMDPHRKKTDFFTIRGYETTTQFWRLFPSASHIYMRKKDECTQPYVDCCRALDKYSLLLLDDPSFQERFAKDSKEPEMEAKEILFGLYKNFLSGLGYLDTGSWLVKNSSFQRCAKECVKNFLRSLRDGITHLEVITPLYYTQFDQEFPIEENVYIKILREVDALRMLRSNRTHIQTITQNACGVVPCAAIAQIYEISDKDKECIDINKQRINDVLNSIRLATGVKTIAPYNFIFQPKVGELNYYKWYHPLGEQSAKHISAARLKNGYSSSPAFKNSDTEAIVEQYKTIKKIRNINAGKNANLIERTLERFDSSIYRANAHDEFLDMLICLETVYGDGHGEITYKLSIRSSVFLGDGDKNKIKEYYDIVKDGYKARSSIVHGSETKRINAEDIFEVTRQSLHKWLEVYSKYQLILRGKEFDKLIMGYKIEEIAEEKK